MDSIPRRIVMHVDMDCFFAAVEERRDPRLKGRPVVVGADPRGGLGRGIVATCNYEARGSGIHSAMPISKAWSLAPEAVYLRPDFGLYSETSRRVMDLLRPRADVFEPAGIDEAYLDVSSRGGFEAAGLLGRAAQADLLSREGLSASVGVGPNKLVAKIASDHKKPGGLTIVPPEEVEAFLGPKDAGALRGVGPKTRERLAALGATTVERLRQVPEQELRARFGSFGSALWREARGLDERPVDPDWEVKSVGRERTFGRDATEAAEVVETLKDCVREVSADLAAQGLWCRTLAVKIRFRGYETHTRQRTLRQATGSAERMERAALELVGPFLARGRPVRLVGFSVRHLGQQEELLPFP